MRVTGQDQAYSWIRDTLCKIRVMAKEDAGFLLAGLPQSLIEILGVFP